MASYDHGKRVLRSWLGSDRGLASGELERGVQAKLQAIISIRATLSSDPEIKFAIHLHWSTLFFTHI